MSKQGYRTWGWSGLLAGLLVVGLTAGAFAMHGEGKGKGKEGCPGGPGMGMSMGMGMGMEPLAGLDLDAKQLEQVKADRTAREKRMIQLHAEMKTLMVDLRAAEDTDKPDPAKIESIAGKLGGLHAKMIVEHAQGRAFLRGLLTPEQKKKLDAGRGRGPCLKGECGDEDHEGHPGHEGRMGMKMNHGDDDKK